MTDAPPSTALIAAGSPAAPDPITKISASRSQLRSLLTVVCSIVFILWRSSHKFRIAYNRKSQNTTPARMLTDNSELDTVLAATIQAVVSASCRGRRQFLPDGLSR